MNAKKIDLNCEFSNIFPFESDHRKPCHLNCFHKIPKKALKCHQKISFLWYFLRFMGKMALFANGFGYGCL